MVFFETTIDNYFVSVHLELEAVGKPVEDGQWELEVFIFDISGDKLVLNIDVRQKKNKPVESIDWRK